MKKIAIIALLTSSAYLGACQNSSSNNSKVINESISTEAYDKKLHDLKDIQLIDVRTPGEYAEGHIENAVNIDVNGADFTTALSKLDKNKPVMVYCLSGGRSSNAASQMKSMGFTEVYNLSGGIMGWRNAGKPTTTATTTVSKGMSITDYQQAVNKAEYVLVDFNATWCEPCKKMMPILEKFTSSRKMPITLLKVDVDKNKELANAKAIASIPYLELYKNGKLVWSHEGYIDEADLIAQTKL